MTMANSHSANRGDPPWSSWLRGLMRQRPTHGRHDDGIGRHVPQSVRGQGGGGSERPAAGGRPQGWRAAGLGEREWQRLRFLRWLYLRGRLSEYPPGGDLLPPRPGRHLPGCPAGRGHLE